VKLGVLGLWLCFSSAMANRTTPQPTTPHAGVIEPLTKPKGMEVWRKQAALGAYEDEKLNIYQTQLHDMGHVFEQARTVRAGLQAVYADRNQHVLDLLSELRADTDARTQVHNHRLKEYSTEFEDKLHKGSKSLIAQLKHDLVLAGKRYTADNKEITRLDEAIQQEVKDCQEHTTAETKPIAKRLQEHSDNLDAQVIERREHHDEYCAVLAEHFKVLRERMVVEEAARKQQFVVINKTAEEEYAAMNVIRSIEDVSLREKCVDLQKQIVVQNEDREKAQVAVVKDMLHYMDQFEIAIAAMNKAQADTTAKMESVKKKTNLQD